MGNYELEANSCECCPKTKDQCIISFKIYDQCRLQNCLTPEMLGPSKVATNHGNCGNQKCGETVVPPPNAKSVSINDLKISKIQIVDKKKNPFKSGCWDLDIRYIFAYKLVFKDGDGCEICETTATNSYKATITLYGSEETGTVMASDIINSDQLIFSEGPYAAVEAKAVALAACMRFVPSCEPCCEPCCCEPCCFDPFCNHPAPQPRMDCMPQPCIDCNPCNPLTNGKTPGLTRPVEVYVTIGLFSIIKLFRPVNLLVESSGFCFPEECEQSGEECIDPCEIFNNIEFPMNIFSPPGKYNGGSCCQKNHNNCN